jgi:hypothetical protein
MPQTLPDELDNFLRLLSEAQKLLTELAQPHSPVQRRVLLGELRASIKKLDTQNLSAVVNLPERRSLTEQLQLHGAKLAL